MKEPPSEGESPRERWDGGAQDKVESCQGGPTEEKFVGLGRSLRCGVLA